MVLMADVAHASLQPRGRFCLEIKQQQGCNPAEGVAVKHQAVSGILPKAPAAHPTAATRLGHMLLMLQLRFNKVAELIHNSTNHRNLERACVTVHFQEIIDLVSSRTQQQQQQKKKPSLKL
jgi:hypothetical protein